MYKIYLTLFFISLFAVSYSQEATNIEIKPKKVSKKGTVYMFWGWNRGIYTNSDIHFTGNDYDFEISKVVAKDRPTPFSIDPYFHPMWITIPQTNLRIGYFINNKYDISIGDDHMKYVMVQGQTVKINGQINHESPFDGIYTNQDIKLIESLLTFEHTDGLNYINTELTRNDNLLELLNITHNPNKVELNTLLGAGIGILYPKSNVMILNEKRHDAFHVAGYGTALKTGLNITFFKHIFFRSELKYGFINMPDIRTTHSNSDKASQHFFFTQYNFCFGFSFNLRKQD